MRWFKLAKHYFYTDGYLEKWFNIWIENPLRTWWKARKYFKMPKIYFRFFFIPYIKPDFEYLEKKLKDRTYIDKHKERIEHFKQMLNKWSVHYYCPYIRYDYIGKIIDIKSTDVGWKDKYNSPRYESNPYIFICLFRFIGLSIGFHVKKINEFGEKENGDMYYWEYLLDYLYYSKSLRLDSCWTYDSKIYRRRIYGETEEEDKFEPYSQIIHTPIFCLNKRGLKAFKELYSKSKQLTMTYINDEMMKQIDGKAELYLAKVNDQHFDYTCKDIDYGIAYVIKEAYKKGYIDALNDNRLEAL